MINGSEESNFRNRNSLSNVVGLYWIVIAGVLLYVILDAIAQILPPHYSPIRDAESDLAVGPYGYIMTINFVNRGLLSLLFVYAFVKTLDLTGAKGASFRSGYYLLTGWGIGAILLAIFPTDVSPTTVSWHGAIHLVVAIVAFICGGVGTFTLARHFDEAASLKRAGRLSMMLGSLSLLFLLVELLGQFLVPHLASKIGGLVERLFLGSVLLWIFAVSVSLISQRRLLQARSETVSTNK